jgi:predicted DNA-binding transcriptional regulator AlpA
VRIGEKLQDHLAYPPRGMRADRAAAYLGMSKSEFLKLVDKGTMPKATKIENMAIWDRLALDLAFEELNAVSNDRGSNTFDQVLGSKE